MSQIHNRSRLVLETNTLGSRSDRQRLDARVPDSSSDTVAEVLRYSGEDGHYEHFSIMGGVHLMSDSRCLALTMGLFALPRWPATLLT